MPPIHARYVYRLSLTPIARQRLTITPITPFSLVHVYMISSLGIIRLFIACLALTPFPFQAEKLAQRRTDTLRSAGGRRAFVHGRLRRRIGYLRGRRARHKIVTGRASC